MSDMPNNNETLKFEPTRQESKTSENFGEVVDDGSSALRLDNIPEEQNRGEEFGKIRHEIADVKGLMIVDPVDEKVILEPIKDIYNRPNFAEKTVKFIRRAGLKIGTTFLALTTLGSAAACGPVEASVPTSEPTITATATQPVEVHVGDATVNTSNNGTNSEVMEATPSSSPTEALTSTPTPTSTETSPTPTAKPIEAAPGILKGKDREEAEVNQRFTDFLNGEGEYTEEKIQNEGFTSFYTDKKDLGCMNMEQKDVFNIQGVMLYYKKVNNGEVFAFGTKDKNGKRIIVPIELPSQLFIESIGRTGFGIYSESSLLSDITPKYFGQRDSTYYDFLRSHIGTVFSLSIPIDISSYDNLPLLPESFGLKIGINSSFMTNINFIDTMDHQFINSFESTKRFFEAEEEPIITVSSFDEIDEFLDTENFSKIPSSDCFYFVDTG